MQLKKEVNIKSKEDEDKEERERREAAALRRQEQAMRRMMQLETARGLNTWAEFADERRRLAKAARSLKNPDLMKGWRSWHEMLEERRCLRNAVARFRNPDITHAFSTWRKAAIDGIKQAAAEKAEASKRKYTALQQQCMEVQRALDEQDKRGDFVRKQLEDALKAGAAAAEGQ